MQAQLEKKKEHQTRKDQQGASSAPASRRSGSRSTMDRRAWDKPQAHHLPRLPKCNCSSHVGS